jgi:hypothetical protein
MEVHTGEMSCQSENFEALFYSHLIEQGSFEKNTRNKFIDLLGFNDSDLKDKIQSLILSKENKNVDASLSTKLNSHLSLNTAKGVCFYFIFN